MRIVESAGYDNYLLEREDKTGGCEQFIAHDSFLVTYHYPVTLLRDVAADLEAQLEHEGAFQRQVDAAATSPVVGATTAPARTAAASRSAKGTKRTMARPGKPGQPDECMVELRRRRRQNKAGHYILEYELRPEHARRRLQTEPAGAAPCGGKNVGDEERR
ncbi:hypothetical protein PR003_g10586 [Phytophthora rubi]|uniref:Uncharacterized protein n=1 Tax=Phytophthora rubi TaxID=129364 RepID=A0A6A4FQN3_9STRA|nr:hypothetical protein PR003_g10586 [Phytophthora rubi]